MLKTIGAEWQSAAKTFRSNAEHRQICQLLTSPSLRAAKRQNSHPAVLTDGTTAFLHKQYSSHMTSSKGSKPWAW